MVSDATEYDVVVVGGGPAGCSAGLFAARYGLDTVIFDRGRSSIQRCAFLENYLGFPGGIDVETLYGLMHDHAESVGYSVVDDLVEAVERDGEGFRVMPQAGDPVTARWVVAATRYDGEYLRPLDGEAMFTTRGGEERFDRDYADADGATPVDGLFVASPYGDTGYQASMAAGRGARVGISLVEAVRRSRGYPDSMANYYDWRRRESELDDAWADRDRWREWFDDRLPDDYGLTEDRVAELRDRDVTRRLDTYLSEADIERRRERAHDRLLDHVDDDRILAAARDIEAERRANE
ncbi:Pyridine nucleotide-disulphide oxidoreductase [Haloplanus vescus]|uniref:Pyridine nucleotide-disulphide oxidoreductase n=1 Tax=Haloplanus vescus TaxID=555874 RepID=A0A1H3VUL0_9EURY|nr:FAD-dependent oxidoreductase [Haloplanus vescus]SDZ77924.1 Pyridine nucleotide-disulphide oxidoreductase [Haloplanus vescus]